MATKKAPKLKPKKQKRLPPRVYTLMKELQMMFGVQNFDRSFCYKKADKDNIAMSIDIDDEYQRIHLCFYPSFWRDSAADQRQHLLHEFCHTLTHELVNRLDDFKRGTLVTPQQIKATNERATSKMTNIVENILLGKEGDVRKAYAQFIHPPRKR